ncbi:MAG: orotate phosphoribosyltransferase [Bacteriovoracaceae bacterium]
MNGNYKAEVAEALLKTGCVNVSPREPFTYASGAQGPIYCDCRKLISYPKERGLVAQSFVELIKENNLEFQHVAGMATAGIPHAAFLSEKLETSMLYIRSSPKGHGLGKVIEGDFKEGDKGLMVEDLVNRASSLDKVMPYVENQKLNVEAVVSIVSYESPVAKENLSKWNLKLYSLTDIHSIATALEALSPDSFGSVEKESLLAWAQDPVSWKPLL